MILQDFWMPDLKRACTIASRVKISESLVGEQEYHSVSRLIRLSAKFSSTDGNISSVAHRCWKQLSSNPLYPPHCLCKKVELVPGPPGRRRNIPFVRRRDCIKADQSTTGKYESQVKLSEMYDFTQCNAVMMPLPEIKAAGKISIWAITKRNSIAEISQEILEISELFSGLRKLYHPIGPFHLSSFQKQKQSRRKALQTSRWSGVRRARRWQRFIEKRRFRDIAFTSNCAQTGQKPSDLSTTYKFGRILLWATE